MDLIFLGSCVLGLTEVVKRSLGLTRRFIPLTALIMTSFVVAAYIIINNVPLDWKLIQDSLIVALTSVGLYSSVKNTIQ